MVLSISLSKLRDNDIEEVIRPLKGGLNNKGYCHNHDAAYRAAMIYSFIATCNKADVNPRELMVDVMPQMKGIAPDDFASLEKLLPGEWKKSHPEPLDCPSHDLGGTHGRHPKIQGKKKATREEASKEESK